MVSFRFEALTYLVRLSTQFQNMEYFTNRNLSLMVTIYYYRYFLWNDFKIELPRLKTKIYVFRVTCSNRSGRYA